MKYNKPGFLSSTVSIALLSVVFILLASLTSPTVEDKPVYDKIKSRFPSMRIDIATARSMTLDPAFHHFIFQQTSTDKSGLFGLRRVYTLIVFAADKDGKIIGPGSIPLIQIEEDGKTDIKDINTEIKLSNYLMSERQFEALIATGTTYLRFDAATEQTADNRRYFDKYVTYKVYGVASTGVSITSADNFNDDNFLKPSPPAPPEL